MRYGIFLFYLLTTLWAIPVQTLVEQGVSYDGKTVTITGEVIGDILYRKNCVWINVLSPEGTAIGIKTTPQNIAPIKITGDYRHLGDTVAITGVFSRFNKEELGETMIFSKTILLLESGYKTVPKNSPKKAIVAAFLLFISLILSITYTNHYLLKQKKKSVI